jgi:DNA modification methylase
VTSPSIASARRRHLHPFPARMAPDLAVDALASLRPDSTVLDPMCGSGTVLHAAAQAGFKTIGFDVDPLAVLLAQVSTSNLLGRSVLHAADKLVAAADSSAPVCPGWIDGEPETLAFTEFWFGAEQLPYLRKLAVHLSTMNGRTADALRVALSRTIITKDHGASLARDVSHSRPHKVADSNDYDVRAGFVEATRRVATWLDANRVSSTARVRLGDCRRLPPRLNGSVDLVITSPPYLNAIDYLRGHRMSLVWLGHQIPALRAIRSASVGTERGLDDPGARVTQIAKASARLSHLPQREQRMMYRYCTDLSRVTQEIARVLRPGGEVVFVVGNSNLKSVFISNSDAVKEASRLAGLKLMTEAERDLPSQHRYLPPPAAKGSSLDKRMNTETVLRLRKIGR